MPKKIVLLSDGTGNSSAKLFRTNVWRLYQALDLSSASGQIARYDDGVGTSSFAPLRILGGVFGYGLGRNVRSLYRYLCTVYAPGDEIYIFGFSRGAFTARVLAGLVASQGVRNYERDADLDSWVRSAYRAYRASATKDDAGRRKRPIVALVRSIRNALIHALGGDRVRTEGQGHHPEIQMVGVWDTVAAYGGPVIEMTRAFDKWIWPLSMPNYRLSSKVRYGRHALAIDEEREAFLPLLWDELGSPQHPREQADGTLDGVPRLVQTWFPGVHADVGGGYPDDGVSYVPLSWMIGEARAIGLSLDPAAVAAIEDGARPLGPLHDSRSGFGGFYRYQPRRIEIYNGDLTNSPLRDPAAGRRQLLREVRLHESVAGRLSEPSARYAPIVLPAALVWPASSRIEAKAQGLARTLAQEAVWNLVLCRRLTQFALLTIIAATSCTPFFPEVLGSEWPDYLLRPLVESLLAMVPFVPRDIMSAYAARPLWLILGIGLIFAFLALGRSQARRIGDIMRVVWHRSIANQSIPAPSPTWFTRIRTSRSAGRLVSLLRWRLVPSAFGMVYWYVLLSIGLLGATQATLIGEERSNEVCPAVAPQPSQVVQTPYSTKDPCAVLPITLRRGMRYEIVIRVTQAWQDADLLAKPVGFTVADSVGQKGVSGLVHLISIPFRRAPEAAWFQPVIAIRTQSTSPLFELPLRVKQREADTYVAEFRAPATGEAHFYVNDAVIPFGGTRTFDFYKNNGGEAIISIEQLK